MRISKQGWEKRKKWWSEWTNSMIPKCPNSKGNSKMRSLNWKSKTRSWSRVWRMNTLSAMKSSKRYLSRGLMNWLSWSKAQKKRMRNIRHRDRSLRKHWRKIGTPLISTPWRTKSLELPRLTSNKKGNNSLWTLRTWSKRTRERFKRTKNWRKRWGSWNTFCMGRSNEKDWEFYALD